MKNDFEGFAPKENTVPPTAGPAGREDEGYSVMSEFDAQLRREYAREDRHFNKRIDLVSRLKTKKYMAQLRELMEDCGVTAAAFVRNTGEGKKQKNEYTAIKWEWVDQYQNGGYSGDSFAGYIYLQIKSDRYLRLQYAM